MKKLASRKEDSQPARNDSSYQVVEPTLEDVNSVEEEDITYSKSTLRKAVTEDVGKLRILGTLWDFHTGNLAFELTGTACLPRRVERTKTNGIRTASKLSNPLGFSSLITLQFKILFQELCKDKTGTQGRAVRRPLPVDLAETGGATA